MIVNQIVRSPGVYFKDEQDKNGRRTYNASVIPNRGAWLKFETIRTTCCTFVLIKTEINAHVLMRAMGLSDNDVIDKLRHPAYYKKSIQKRPTTKASALKTKPWSSTRSCAQANPSVSGGQQLLQTRFFDPKRYTWAGSADTRSTKSFASRFRIRFALSLTRMFSPPSTI